MARALLQASMPFVRSSSRAFSASTGHPGSGPRLLPRFPSPLTYPGAKTFGIQAIHDVISKHFDLSSIRQLVSPFFGGGSLELALQHKYPHLRVFGNDLNLPLVCFWKAFRRVREIPLCSGFLLCPPPPGCTSSGKNEPEQA